PSFPSSLCTSASVRRTRRMGVTSSLSSSALTPEQSPRLRGSWLRQHVQPSALVVSALRLSRSLRRQLAALRRSARAAAGAQLSEAHGLRPFLHPRRPSSVAWLPPPACAPPIAARP